MSRIAAAGIPLKAVQPVDQDGRVLPVNLLTPAESRGAPATRISGRACAIAVGLAAVLLTAGTVSRIMSLEQAVACHDSPA